MLICVHNNYGVGSLPHTMPYTITFKCNEAFQIFLKQILQFILVKDTLNYNYLLYNLVSCKYGFPENLGWTIRIKKSVREHYWKHGVNT